MKSMSNGIALLCMFLCLPALAAWAQPDCFPQNERRDCPFGRCTQTGSRFFVECNSFGDLLGCENLSEMDRWECQQACSVDSTPIFRCSIIACDEESDCVNGGHCAFGVCQECRNDADCGSGTICEASSCIPRPEGFCRKNDDCPRSFRCDLQAAQCRAFTGHCESDHDCGRGFVCIEHLRVRNRFIKVGACIGALASPTRCNSRNDCPQGFHCLYGRCSAIKPTKDGITPCLPNPLCPNMTKCGATGGLGLCPPPEESGARFKVK